MAYEICPNCRNKKHVLLACSFCGHRRLDESRVSEPPIAARTKNSPSLAPTYELAQLATNQANRKRQERPLRKQGQSIINARPKNGEILAINAQQIERLEKGRKIRVARYAKKRGISIAQANRELMEPVKTKRKSAPEYRKTSNRHLTSSLYSSISRSIWYYQS
jgi:hypothetical protein